MKGGFLLTEGFQDYLEKNNIKTKNYQTTFINYLKTVETGFELISDSSNYGFIFKQTVDESPALQPSYVSSKCDSIFSSKCYQSINSFVYKLSFIGTHDKRFSVIKDDDSVISMYLTGLANVSLEAKVQSQIFNNRFNGGLNLVPPILSEKPVLTGFDGPFFESCVRFSSFNNCVKSAIEAGATGLAIICMGFAEGYKPLYDFLNDELCSDKIHKYVSFARVAFLELLIKDRVVHGDSHISNIMFNPDYPNWLVRGSKGRPIIIDFGLARPVKAEENAIIEANIGVNLNPKVLLDIIVTEHNAEWLRHPYCCSQCLNDDGIDNDELIHLYNKHQDFLASIDSKIREQLPGFNGGKVTNVMKMIRGKKGGTRKLAARRGISYRSE